ncbi:hypothetical protein [Paenibacillus sp. MMS18-CY102]|uniref:hypothetical protein n=1 Tax=Paenibacillus sp. MMS18-CY102 TaxID=2682849 RepID=UPI001365F5C0|nr:hypothetical protein [Paenibacillus sp. MMS18-CY102]MWC28065.1 hypothetical protein [Paenibacillus sp. MMS18-CY102]
MGNVKLIKGKAVLMLLILLVSAGCSTSEPGNSISHTEANKPETVHKETSEPCKAEIDWVDFVMINNIKYHQNYEGTQEVSDSELGGKVGEITFNANEQACLDYTMKNGDAAFLPVGTAIYAMKGYKPEFRIVADHKVYEVNENPNAATMGDLLDIHGRVEKVSLESGDDGSAIGDFTPEASTAFVDGLLPLAYVGFDEVYKKSQSESGVFLRVHLKDGTSFRMVYYPKANAFNAGAFGTEQLRTLIMSQRMQIKAAAGL